MEISLSYRLETRGHSMKVLKPRHTTTKRNKFFSSRTVDKWNSLAENVVNSTTDNVFKNRYDQFEIETKLRRGTGTPYEL